MKHLTAAAGIVLLCFVFATASPLEESATEIGAKQQRNQMTQPSITAANQVLKLYILFYCIILVLQIEAHIACIHGLEIMQNCWVHAWQIMLCIITT